MTNKTTTAPTFISVGPAAPSYPAYKFGGRWVCDGPYGRFHAKTKQELVELLKAGGDLDAKEGQK